MEQIWCLTVKGQGHWERKYKRNVFHAYLRQKCINLCRTKTNLNPKNHTTLRYKLSLTGAARSLTTSGKTFLFGIRIQVLGIYFVAVGSWVLQNYSAAKAYANLVCRFLPFDSGLQNHRKWSNLTTMSTEYYVNPLMSTVVIWVQL